jgi:non-ribosomal peptide synthetase component F
MQRTQLYADPAGRFVHDLILESANKFPEKTALVDASANRRLSYAEYAETINSIARGLVAAGLSPAAFQLCSTRRIAIVKSATSLKILEPLFSLRMALCLRGFVLTDYPRFGAFTQLARRIPGLKVSRTSFIQPKHL